MTLTQDGAGRQKKSDERIEQQEIQLYNSVHLFTQCDYFRLDLQIIVGKLSSRCWETTLVYGDIIIQLFANYRQLLKQLAQLTFANCGRRMRRRLVGSSKYKPTSQAVCLFFKPSNLSSDTTIPLTVCSKISKPGVDRETIVKPPIRTAEKDGERRHLYNRLTPWLIPLFRVDCRGFR